MPISEEPVWGDETETEDTDTEDAGSAVWGDIAPEAPVAVAPGPANPSEAAPEEAVWGEGAVEEEKPEATVWGDGVQGKPSTASSATLFRGVRTAPAQLQERLKKETESSPLTKWTRERAGTVKTVSDLASGAITGIERLGEDVLGFFGTPEEKDKRQKAREAEDAENKRKTEKTYDVSEAWDPATGTVDLDKLLLSNASPELRRAFMEAELERQFPGMNAAWIASKYLDDRGGVNLDADDAVTTFIKKWGTPGMSVLGEAVRDIADTAQGKVPKLVITQEAEDAFEREYGKRIEVIQARVNQTGEPETVNLGGVAVEVNPGDVMGVLASEYTNNAFLSALAEVRDLTVSGFAETLGEAMAAVATGGTSVLLNPVSTAGKKVAPKLVAKAPWASNLVLNALEGALLSQTTPGATLGQSLEERAIAGTVGGVFSGTLTAPGALIRRMGGNAPVRDVPMTAQERGLRADAEAAYRERGNDILAVMDDPNLPEEIKNQALAVHDVEQLKTIQPNEAATLQDFQQSISSNPRIQGLIDESIHLSSGRLMTAEGVRMAHALMATSDPGHVRRIGNMSNRDLLEGLQTKGKRTASLWDQYGDIINDPAAVFARMEERQDFRLNAAREQYGKLSLDTVRTLAANQMLKSLNPGDLADVNMRNIWNNTSRISAGIARSLDLLPYSTKLVESLSDKVVKHTEGISKGYAFISKNVDKLIAEYPGFREPLETIKNHLDNAYRNGTAPDATAMSQMLTELRGLQDPAVAKIRRGVQSWTMREDRIRQVTATALDQMMNNEILDLAGVAYKESKGKRTKAENVINNTSVHVGPEETRTAVRDHFSPFLRTLVPEERARVETHLDSISDSFFRKELPDAQQVQGLKDFVADRLETLVKYKEVIGEFKTALSSGDPATVLRSAQAIQQLLSQMNLPPAVKNRLVSGVQEFVRNPTDVGARQLLTTLRQNSVFVGEGSKGLLEEFNKGLDLYSREVTRMTNIREGILKVADTGDASQLPLLISQMRNQMRLTPFDFIISEHRPYAFIAAQLWEKAAREMGIDPKATAQMFQQVVGDEIAQIRLHRDPSLATPSVTHVQNVFDAVNANGLALLNAYAESYENTFGKALDKEVFLANFLTPGNAFGRNGRWEVLGLSGIKIEAAQAQKMGLSPDLYKLLSSEIVENRISHDTAIACNESMGVFIQGKRRGQAEYSDFLIRELPKDIESKMRREYRDYRFANAVNILDGVEGMVDFFDGYSLEKGHFLDPLGAVHQRMFIEENSATNRIIHDRKAFTDRAKELLAAEYKSREIEMSEAGIARRANNLFDYFGYKPEGHFEPMDAAFWTKVWDFRKMQKEVEATAYKQYMETLERKNHEYRHQGVQIAPRQWRERRVGNKRQVDYDMDEFSMDLFDSWKPTKNLFGTDDFGQREKASGFKIGDKSNPLSHPIMNLMNSVRGLIGSSHVAHSSAVLQNYGIILDSMGHRKAAEWIDSLLLGNVSHAGLPMDVKIYQAALKNPFLRPLVTAGELFAKTVGGAYSISMSLIKPANMIKNAYQTYTLSRAYNGHRYMIPATGSVWIDTPTKVVDNLLGAIPYGYHVIRGWATGQPIRASSPPQVKILKDVLLGQRESRHRTQMKRLVDLGSSMTGNGFDPVSSVSMSISSGLDRVNAFMMDMFKERMELSISGQVMSHSAIAFNGIVDSWKQGGRGAAGRYLQSVLPSLPKNDHWQILDNIERAMGAGEANLALADFAVRYHDVSVGRFGKYANPIAINNLAQSLPAYSLFFAAKSMNAYRALNMGATIGADAISFVTKGKSMGVPRKTSAWFYAMAPSLATFWAASYVFMNGVPSDSYKEQLLNDDEAFNFKKIALGVGLGKWMGIDTSQLVPLNFLATSGRGGNLKEEGMWQALSLVNPLATALGLSIKDYMATTDDHTKRLKSLEEKFENETDEGKKQQLAFEMTNQLSFWSEYKAHLMFDAILRHAPLNPAGVAGGVSSLITGGMVDIAKSPTLATAFIYKFLHDTTNSMPAFYNKQDFRPIQDLQFMLGVTLTPDYLKAPWVDAFYDFAEEASGQKFEAERAKAKLEWERYMATSDDISNLLHQMGITDERGAMLFNREVEKLLLMGELPGSDKPEAEPSTSPLQREIEAEQGVMERGRR